jgi:hypothetical protein
MKTCLCVIRSVDARSVSRMFGVRMGAGTSVRVRERKTDDVDGWYVSLGRRIRDLDTCLGWY